MVVRRGGLHDCDKAAVLLLQEIYSLLPASVEARFPTILMRDGGRPSEARIHRDPACLARQRHNVRAYQLDLV